MILIFLTSKLFSRQDKTKTLHDLSLQGHTYHNCPFIHWTIIVREKFIHWIISQVFAINSTSFLPFNSHLQVFQLLSLEFLSLFFVLLVLELFLSSSEVLQETHPRPPLNHHSTNPFDPKSLSSLVKT